MPDNNNNNEILKAIQGLATQVDTRFGVVEEAVQELATQMDKRFEGVDGRFEGVEKRLTKMEATMVTKDYLDDKLADLKGDIVVKQRKIEGRIDTLVTMPQNRNLLASSDVKLLSDLRVFPHIGE